MKTNRRRMTKILATSLALLIFSASQALAGSVVLNGQVDWVTDSDTTGVTEASPVSLEISWVNDLAVPGTGEAMVELNPEWGNNFTFTVGDITLTADPVQGELPLAHFTDGKLDFFKLNWFESSIGGVSGSSWSIFALGDARLGDQDIFWEIMDEGSFTGDWFEGHLNFPGGEQGGSPVPVPGALWLFGSGLMGLGALRRKMA